jgi:pimeloyl-ACP methyl ester carboxylesterase
MDKPLVFGKLKHLIGVENIVKNSSIAVIMMTPGMLHNTGPFRLHVDMAQNLEQHGISSLRFDISGIGESLGVGTSGKSIDRAATEAIEAMDYLMDSTGIEQFILFGLCSGADDSIQAALKDKRVKGVISLDGAAYKTTRFKYKEACLMARKMLSISKWVNKFHHLTGNSKTPASLAMGSDIREFPETAEQACKELQQLVDSEVQLHFIYTGGTEYYNYSQQFYDMLPNMKWKGTESTEYFSQMDHVVMLCEDRKLLIDHIIAKTLNMSQRMNAAAA